MAVQRGRYWYALDGNDAREALAVRQDLRQRGPSANADAAVGPKSSRQLQAWRVDGTQKVLRQYSDCRFRPVHILSYRPHLSRRSISTGAAPSHNCVCARGAASRATQVPKPIRVVVGDTARMLREIVERAIQLQPDMELISMAVVRGERLPRG
jgi:hypothetical protein